MVFITTLNKCLTDICKSKLLLCECSFFFSNSHLGKVGQHETTADIPFTLIQQTKPSLNKGIPHNTFLQTLLKCGKQSMCLKLNPLPTFLSCFRD